MHHTASKSPVQTRATKIAFHAACTGYGNIVTDIRAARHAGFDGIELSLQKLFRYLDAGFSVEELRGHLGPLKVTMLDVLLGIESRSLEKQRVLEETCLRAAQLAAALDCKTLQVVALDDFQSSDPATQQRQIITSMERLSKLTASYEVRLALEPVCFSPFRQLERAVEAVEAVGRHRACLVLDTWHLWTSKEDWDVVASVDPGLIGCSHLSDTLPRAGKEWSDFDRCVLPGDGVLPLETAVQAIRATGYEGPWSVEIISKKHREWDPNTLSVSLLARARALLASTSGRAFKKEPTP